MSTFKDILDGGFEAHTHALPASGGFSGGRSRAVLRSIHRRRRTRAAATAGGSVLAVGAVAVGAMALRPFGVAQPGMTPPITNGLYPWCDLSTYPAVNLEALGAKAYLGRIYEDYVNSVFIYVAPDGSRTTIQPDAEGSFRIAGVNGDRPVDVAPPDIRAFLQSVPAARGGVVIDIGVGSAGGFWNPGGPEGPYLGYEWTTVIPDDVPAGVDVVGLSDTLALSLGFSGMGFVEDMVPKGAIVETVFRWHDGRQQAIRIQQGDPGPQVPDYTNLASVSVRVRNLSDGGVFEMTSTYDPSQTWQVACWPYRDGASASAAPSVNPTPSPSPGGWASPSSSPGVSQGGFDSRPTPSPSFVTPAPSPTEEPLLPYSSPAPTP